MVKFVWQWNYMWVVMKNMTYQIVAWHWIDSGVGFHMTYWLDKVLQTELVNFNNAQWPWQSNTWGALPPPLHTFCVSLHHCFAGSLSAPVCLWSKSPFSISALLNFHDNCLVCSPPRGNSFVVFNVRVTFSLCFDNNITNLLSGKELWKSLEPYLSVGELGDACRREIKECICITRSPFISL